ncbi:MAG: NAD(+) synthase [Clostridiales bacterium]|jgi:NAD+ synthase|nr:NAD(+) synthase [Clostridiales bacterium]
MFEKNFVVTERNAAEYIGKIGDFIRGRLKAAGCGAAMLGLSGGIDSAVVAGLCRAAGVKLYTLLLPDGAAAERGDSVAHAEKLAEKFGIERRIVNIGEIAAAIDKAAGSTTKTSKINVRPRVRMVVLYAAAQSANALVLGTGNLSERVLGYFTKWGDGANDINPLGLLTKREVRILARALGVIPEIIDKAPSADLYDGQTDEGETGITYGQVDDFILNGTSGDADIDGKIKARTESALHKLTPVPIFGE